MRHLHFYCYLSPVGQDKTTAILEINMEELLTTLLNEAYAEKLSKREIVCQEW